jgi:chemotaxis protein CheC
MSTLLKSIAKEQFGLSALCEAGNIGAGNAMSALAGIVHDRVNMSDPAAGIVPIGKFGEIAGSPDEMTVGVFLGVSGDASGHVVLLWPIASALRLADQLLERPAGATSLLDELECSALMEVGNILASAYLVAVSDLTGLLLLSSPPAIAVDAAAAILCAIGAEVAVGSDDSFVIVTQIGGPLDDLGGHFIFIPEMDCLPRILQALQVGC